MKWANNSHHTRQDTYQRVEEGLSQSNTATSLDTILPEDPFLFSRGPTTQQRQMAQQNTFGVDDTPLQFGPIIEDNDIHPPPPLPLPLSQAAKSTSSQDFVALPPPPAAPHSHRDHHQRSTVSLANEELQRSKQSLKGSRVSFERRSVDSSDEDNFESRRSGYQQQKTISVDHKGILKVCEIDWEFFFPNKCAKTAFIFHFSIFHKGPQKHTGKW